VTSRAALLLAVFLAACRDHAGPSCDDVAAHVGTLFGSDTELRDVFALRCREDRWTAEVRRCLRATDDPARGRGCRQQLDDRQRARLESDVTALESRDRARTLPSECAAYGVVLGRLDCPAIDPAEQAALVSRFADAKQAWVGGMEEGRFASMCASALASLRQLCP